MSEPVTKPCRHFLTGRVTTSTDCPYCESDDLKKELEVQKYAADNCRRLLDESDHAYAELRDSTIALEKLIDKVHAAKGRYHTQLAMCDLFDAVNLPNERPKK